MKAEIRPISPWLKKRIAWRRLIKKLKPGAKFNPPSTKAEIKHAEMRLKVKFPVDLINLLLETNGVDDWLLSVSSIISTNEEYRTNPEIKKSTPLLTTSFCSFPMEPAVITHIQF